MDIIKNNIVIIVIVVAAIGFFAWFGLSNTVAESGLLVGSGTSTSAVDQEILKLLLDMKSITLDSSLFENPAFTTLRDFGRDILPEPVGRSNPFEPTRAADKTTEVNTVQDRNQSEGQTTPQNQTQ